MAKQLTVSIAAQDQASTVIKGIIGNVMGVGAAAEKSQQKTDRVASSIGRVVGSLKTYAVALAAVFGARAVLSSIDQTVEKLDGLEAKATELGLTFQELSGGQYLAKLVGNINPDEFAASLGTLTKAAGLFARTGGGRAAESFKALGIEARGADGKVKPMSQLLPELSQRFAAIENTTERASLGARLFGDNAAAMTRVLAEGPERIRAWLAEAQKLGAVFSNEQVQAAANYRDALDRINFAWTGVKAGIIAQFGNSAARLLNQAASVVASLPDIFGNLARTVSDALSGESETGRAARAALASMGQSIILLAQAVAYEGAALVFAGLADAVSVGWEAVYQVSRGFFVSLPQRLGPAIAVAYNTVSMKFTESLIDIFGPRSAAALGFYKSLDDDKQRIEDSLLLDDDVVRKNKRSFTQISADIREAMKNTGPSAFGSMWQESLGNISTAADDTFNSLDQVLKITDALARHRIAPLPGKPTPISIGGEFDSSSFTALTAGASEGLNEFLLKARDLRQQGKEAVAEVGGALTNTLTPAIWDSITATDSWANNFKKAGKAIVDTLGQIAIKMLVLRAISGIAGAFAGGTAVGSGLDPANSAFGAGTPVYYGANSGGLVPRRLAAGGRVGGPFINRDIVPALLTPGERVLSREQNRQYEQGGAAPSIVSNVTVNISGGGGGGGASAAGQSVAEVKRAVEAAAYDGLMRALRGSPSKVESLRAAIL